MDELLPLDRAFRLSYRGIESAQLFKQKENISSRSKKPRRCSKSHQNIVISCWRFFLILDGRPYHYPITMIHHTPYPIPGTPYPIPHIHHTPYYIVHHAACIMHHTPYTSLPTRSQMFKEILNASKLSEHPPRQGGNCQNVHRKWKHWLQE